MRDFTELKVWVKAHQLTLAVYRVTSTFPAAQLHGLTSQARRSCASIAANIPEGFGRNGNVELSRFFQIAMGSASELEYHLLLAHDLHLIKSSEYECLAENVLEVKQMLASFIKRLNARAFRTENLTTNS
ncbi:MAG: four helix bundle protein [Okeania sp. SIO2C9]|uniref:four helix bundle protein n=1 Tax=Okeania sp. SIO2C9 TaxID=2607791 RepID=UPI0013C2217F|nr:four helix bundle protein [Okeania sp. SIO2C9]NEQ75529.1 four helix bundle protein [Okeania sp. SIO2C9]